MMITLFIKGFPYCHCTHHLPVHRLQGRKGKAPVGGVNTLEMPDEKTARKSASPTTPEIPNVRCTYLFC